MTQVREARFLDCWPKVQELRREYAKKTWTAKERGDLMTWTSPIPYNSFLAGFGETWSIGSLGTNYTKVMTDPHLLNKCMQKYFEEGYSQNLCGMFKTTLCQMLGGVFNTSLRTGERVDLDIFFDMHVCQGQVRSFPLWAKYYPGIHYVGIELPYSNEHEEYLVMQLHEAVERIEKALDREYNDDLARVAFKNEWATHRYCALTSELQKNVPAPFNSRWLVTVHSVGFSHQTTHRPETVELFRIAYEEGKERVEKGIGAVPEEKCRLLHEGVSSWYPSPVLRYPNRFGGNFILTGQHACGMGTWMPSNDFSLEVAPPLEEVKDQFPLNTRDEIFRSMAKMWLTYMRQLPTLQDYPLKTKQLLKVVEDWHIDGVMINTSMECRGLAGLSDEDALALKEKGIPVMVYEGSPNIPSDFNQEKWMAQTDAFMEGFGLKPLPGFVPVEPPEYIEF